LASVTADWRIVSLFTSLLLLNVAYSLKPVQLSRRGGFAQLLLPLGYTVLTFNSGFLLSGGHFTAKVLVLNSALYLHFIARLALKDHRDVVGDRQASKITPVIKYGNRVVAYASLVLFAASAILLSLAAPWLTAAWRPSLVCSTLFAGGAIMSLQQLTQEDRWNYQKPLITMFGRCCSGLIITIAVATAADIANFSTGQLIFMLLIVAAAFNKSLFDILRLQHPDLAKLRKA
jgi:4-hydroxybenzoate polyprenyltransferase